MKLQIDIASLKSSIFAPIIFVTVMMLIIAYFGEFITKFDPYLQFLIITVPLSIIVLYYFGKNFDGWRVIAGLILINWAIDLVEPPYMVGLDGVLHSEPLFAATSIDYLIGNTLSGFGISGFILFIFTYIVTFAALFLLANWLVKRK